MFKCVPLETPNGTVKHLKQLFYLELAECIKKYLRFNG